VYDMYPWNEPDSAGRGDDPPIPPRSPEGSPPSQAPLGGDPSPQSPLGGDPSPQAPLVRAVQVALDRRDNGGDAVATAGQPTTQPTAGQPTTQPTAGLTRQ
jgi:hypothetical protein